MEEPQVIALCTGNCCYSLCGSARCRCSLYVGTVVYCIMIMLAFVFGDCASVLALHWY